MISLRFIIDFIGRVLLCTTFVVAIPPQIIKFDKSLEYYVSQGVPVFAANLLLYSSIILTSIGCYLLFFGNRRISTLLLLISLTPTVFLFYISPFRAELFFTNLGLIGSLILLSNKSIPRSKYSSTNTIFMYIEQLYRSIVNYIRRMK